MTLSQLNYLITISEEKSFTRAAEKLFVSQPSLSLCVKNIENELGAVLFDRTSNPISLTPAGEIYINWAKTVIFTKQKIYTQIKDISCSHRTLLRIGGAFERIRSFVMPITKQFTIERPLCDLEIIEDQSSRIKKLLEDGKIDISIGTNNENSILYNSIPICEETPVLAVPKEMCNCFELPEGNCPSIDLSIFKDLPFIALSAEQTYGNYFRRCCTEFGFVPNIKIECRMLNTLHSLVACGIGAGFVTNAFFTHSRNDENVRYFSLSNISPIRYIYLSYRADYYLSNDAKTFISLLENYSHITLADKSIE